jgi:hypothetical protein
MGVKSDSEVHRCDIPVEYSLDSVICVRYAQLRGKHWNSVKRSSPEPLIWSTFSFHHQLTCDEIFKTIYHVYFVVV